MRRFQLLTALLTLAGCAAHAASGPATQSPEPQSAHPVQAADPPATDVLVGRCSAAFGPSEIPAELASARWGADTATFSAISTTRDRAVEVCGVDGQLDWLTRVRCDDGTPAFAGPEQAHRARRGNVGPGGPCGHIIDLYDVPCPERTYEVYMDLYVCSANGT